MGKLTRRTSLTRSSETNKRSSSAHASALSSSMIMAVNDASQTARSVLDQAAAAILTTTSTDNKPSSDDRSRTSSCAHQSFTGSLSSGAEEDDDCNSSSSDESTQLVSHRSSSSRSTTNSRGGGSAKSNNGEDYAGTTYPGGGGPPISAFQNLPMSRRFMPSHRSHSDGGGVDDKTATTIDDIFANGGGDYHVMNHFDTAVAISAALASSNLADAAGSSVGMLSQLSSSHNNNNNSYPAKPKGRRNSTENDTRTKTAGFVEGRGQSITTTTERTKSTGSSGLPSLEEAKARMLMNRDSYSLPEADFSFVNNHNNNKDNTLSVLRASQLSQLSFDNEELLTTISNKNEQMINIPEGSEQKEEEQQPTFVEGTKTAGFVEGRGQSITTTTERTKSTGSSGLPSLEEAKARMLMNRDSYSLPEADFSFVNNHNNNKDNTLSVLRASQLSQLSFDNEELLTTISNKNEQMINIPEGSEQKEEEQQLRSLSEHSNESNTSSVDGVNYSSDVSPITSEGSGGENNKHNGGEVSKVGILGTLQSRRNEGRDDGPYGGVEDDEYSTNSERSDPRGVITASKKLKIQGEELPKQRRVTRDKSTSKVDDFNVERERVASMNDQVAEHSAEHPPAHLLSLFSSFDRRWEEAVEGRENSEHLLNLGKKCFAAFVSIFTSCNDSSGRSFFGNSTFRWWIDDDSLTNLDEIISIEKDTPQGIPIAVIRCLWKNAFVDSSVNKDETNHILDSIQHILVTELCYLIVSETKSTKCLYLACDVHAEYGSYILEQLSLKHQMISWHSEFALELRRLLIDSDFTDTDCEFSLSRLFFLFEC